MHPTAPVEYAPKPSNNQQLAAGGNQPLADGCRNPGRSDARSPHPTEPASSSHVGQHRLQTGIDVPVGAQHPRQRGERQPVSASETAQPHGEP